MLMMFPGQGSHHVGMGQSFAECYHSAKEVFEEVDDRLGERLSELMFSGPEEELGRTYNSQPAIMSCSIAVLRSLYEELGQRLVEDNIAYVAGHSLGEYSALCTAQSLSLSQAVGLLRLRGRAMYEAFPSGGGMVACLGVKDLQCLEDAIASEPGCFVANDNGAGQVVLSGKQEALDKVIATLKGSYRFVKLNVDSPFHCPLIENAKEALALGLGNADFQPPLFPCIANVTAAEVSDPAIIRDLLLQQVSARVRWRETIELCISRGVRHYLELGSNLLGKLVKRMDASLHVYSIRSVEDLHSFIEDRHLLESFLCSRSAVSACQ